jgi:hypothetical protein
MISLLELLPSLIEKSKEGKIAWEQLSANSFTAKLGNLDVDILQNGSDTLLRVRNDDGSVLDAVSYLNTPTPTDKLIKEVYALARRVSMRVDEKIEGLKNILDQL